MINVHRCFYCGNENDVEPGKLYAYCIHCQCRTFHPKKHDTRDWMKATEEMMLRHHPWAANE